MAKLKYDYGTGENIEILANIETIKDVYADVHNSLYLRTHMRLSEVGKQVNASLKLIIAILD